MRFNKRTLKGDVRDISPPYTVLRVALVDIGTNKTVRLLENMLLRCVGFSWRSPCVTKSSTHPSVSSAKTHAGILRVAPHWQLGTKSEHRARTGHHGISHPVVSNPIKSFRIRISRLFHSIFSCFFLSVYSVCSVVSIPLNPFKIRVSFMFCVLFFCGLRFVCVIFLFFRGHFCGFNLFLGQKCDAVCCEIG